MQEKAFITTFLRGTEWAASGKVTLPAEMGLAEPATNGVRVLVITGGHEHEASFHVFDETYKGLFISPNIKPLLVTDNPTNDPAVAWIGPCTTSKVVFIQLGHDHSPFRHPSYSALVRNSILWTAGKL